MTYCLLAVRWRSRRHRVRSGECALSAHVVDETCQRTPEAVRHRRVAAHRRLPESVPVVRFVAARTTLSIGTRSTELRTRRCLPSRAGLSPSRSVVRTRRRQDCAIADPGCGPPRRVANVLSGGTGASEPAIADGVSRCASCSGASYARAREAGRVTRPRRTVVSAGEFARVAADADPGLVGWCPLSAGKRRGGAAVDTIAGRSWIADEIHGVAFRVPAATSFRFTPPRPRCLETTCSKAGSPRRVVELYGASEREPGLARRGARRAVVGRGSAAIALRTEPRVRWD